MLKQRWIVMLTCVALFTAASGAAHSADDEHAEPLRARRLKTGGAALFFTGYGFAAFIAVATSVDYMPSMGESETHYAERPNHYLPLLIPIVGPAVTLSHSEVRSRFGDVFWVSLSGAAQLTGATLYVIGHTVPAKVALNPVVTRDFAGLHVTGRL